MSDLATLIAQLSGSNQQSASDPAMAAVKLARASLDALVLKLGQTIDAKVVGQLAAGLTQLSTGVESFVLKLETPLPTGTAVTIKVAPGPQGTPAVIVSVPAATPHAAPLPIPTSTAPLVQAQAPQPTSPPASAPQPLPQATQLPLATPPTPPGVVPAAKPVPQAAAPPQAPAAQPAAATLPLANAPQPPPANTPLSPPPQPAATPIAPSAAPVLVTATIPAAAPSASPMPTRPAAQVALPVGAPSQQPVAVALQLAPPPATRPAAMPVTPLPAAPAAAVPQPAAPVAVATPPPTVPMAPAAPTPPASPPSSVTTPPAPILATPLAPQPQQPLPTHPSPYPAHVPHPAAPVVAQQLPLPAAQPAAPLVTPRPAAPLNLADPAQAAARQDSAAPLLAKLAAIVTAAAPSVPRPVLEAAQKLLANRIDLNRAAPDGKSLEAAVLKAGVLLSPLTREAPADSKSALLALRSTLLAFLGGDATAPVATTVRPAPPIKGEPPRAPVPQPAVLALPADSQDTARALLGHTDAALSRLKLLQSASQPSADARVDAPAPRNELRVEIPMLLGAETGILQLMVERDGKQKRDPERQRGWRMRFAVNFTTSGEVGADIAMLGRSASIAIWAADPDTADALDELLPELAPAIQRHGLELTSLRVRRGAPQHTRTAPGQLLDSAR